MKGNLNIKEEVKRILSDLQEGFKVQQSSANIMCFMVQDLLDYAQIKANKFRKVIKTFNIREIIEKVMCVQRQKALEQGIQFYPEFVNIAEKEGDCILQHSPMIKSDEQRIMQVLLGLQSNALKFTKKGKVIIRVEIFEEEEKRYIQISVVDTGIGIAKEDQKKLFKLFGFVQDSK